MIISEIKDLFELIFLKKKIKKFVFYSESYFYTNFYFELFINLRKTQKAVIVSSDINEIIFLRKKNIKCFYIKNNLLKTLFFSLLNCDYIIMTMSDIGNNYPKSIFKVKYIYYFHSLASTHKIYTEKAFDNYDYIFVNGNYQVKEIRLNEKANNLKKKKLIKTGYFFLNYLKNKIKNNINYNKTILFAPSWSLNEKNLFNDYGKEIIKKLIKLKYKVILRPHPEIEKRFPNKIDEVKKFFSDNKNFYLDKSASNLESMEKSFLCITDNSTITIEYALSLKRQILYLNYKEKIHNPKYKTLEMETLENMFKKQIGASLDIEEFLKFNFEFNKIFHQNISYKKRLKEFEKNYFYDSKKSVKIAIDFLNNLSEKQK